MKTKEDIVQWLYENEEPFIKMADFIWANPEPAYHEFKSSKYQADYLEEAGFRVKWDIGGINTAFVAEWGSGKPTIGILGEYDALASLSQKVQTTPEPVVPGGAGHGCGHNLLGTGGLAAAVAIRHWLEDTGRKGTIRYYGCPAEEVLAGKTFMARDGVFDDLDVALNYHPGSTNSASKGSMVGLSDIKFRFHGRTAHAGGSPHLGRSALDAVELMNVGVNYLREHVTSNVRMHYVITHGGDLPNVVPAEAEVWYFLRAHKPEEMDELLARVRKVAQGAALMTETTMEEIFQGACSYVLSNHYLADLQFENMKALGSIQFTDDEMKFAQELTDRYPKEYFTRELESIKLKPEDQHLLDEVKDKPLWGINIPPYDLDVVATGSTDVGDVSLITPLSMVWTACGPVAVPGHNWGTTASVGSTIGHKGMMHAARTMAATAYDLFTDPVHIQKAREEFMTATQGKRYKNPIPAHVQPPVYPNPERE